MAEHRYLPSVGSDNPGWLLALIAKVDYYEYVHAKAEGDDDVCFAAEMEAVPEDVLFEARGYARARREAKDG